MSLKTVIVTPQLPVAYSTGGIGTFVENFASLIGENVTIIFTSKPERPERQWLPHFEQQDIEVVTVPHRTRPQPGYPWFVARSHEACALIPDDVDIVYFQDWQATGLKMARSRRYQATRRPVIVTALHGGTQWNREGMSAWPSYYEELALDYCEHYVAQHSDFVVSPSQYMIDWVVDHGWTLPPENRVCTLGLPFSPPTLAQERRPRRGKSFKRVAFFGRLDTRKGFELFVDALRLLAGEPCLDNVDEVTFLGSESTHRYGSAENAATLLEDETGVSVEILNNATPFEAQTYLADHAHDTLVVVPSRTDNFPYTIIEASLIPGLNIICAEAGGIPEILGAQGQDQLFEPHVKPLASKIEEWLLRGPRRASELAQYNWRAANKRWKAFHEEVCEYAQAQAGEAVTTSFPAVLLKNDECPLDVCVPYHNHGSYLPYTLESLEKQSFQDFSVTVVNDGSTDENSVAVFEEMELKYRDRGWQFIYQENQGVCAARNLAVSLGQAKYICFLDADNVAAPNMIERFLKAAHHSGDDCLTCYMHVFKGKGWPWVGKTKTLRPAMMVYVPIGSAPVAGLLANALGDATSIMRRSVFEELGGYTENYSKYIGQEDQEFLTRLVLRGYRLDVVPEVLVYYRLLEESRLRTTDAFLNELRVIRVYEEFLSEVGLEGLAHLAMGLRYDPNVRLDPASLHLDGRFDWIVNGIRWQTLLRALGGKILKYLGRLSE